MAASKALLLLVLGLIEKDLALVVELEHLALVVELEREAQWVWVEGLTRKL